MANDFSSMVITKAHNMKPNRQVYHGMFVFVLRFYGLVNPMGSCWVRSVYLTTRLLGRLSPKRLTSIVYIFSPETDNCPSWISGRERMTVENISWSISTKECCRPRQGLNPRPPGLQSDSTFNWAAEALMYHAKEIPQYTASIFCTPLIGGHFSV